MDTFTDAGFAAVQIVDCVKPHTHCVELRTSVFEPQKSPAFISRLSPFF